jgi:hypothetical protein
LLKKVKNNFNKLELEMKNFVEGKENKKRKRIFLKENQKI